MVAVQSFPDSVDNRFSYVTKFCNSIDYIRSFEQLFMRWDGIWRAAKDFLRDDLGMGIGSAGDSIC